MVRILAVEDQCHNMRLINQIIEDMDLDIELEGAETGNEALAKAVQCRYDLVLMDISLPDIDGVKITTILRNEFDYRGVPIIAVTAHAMMHDEEVFRSIFDDLISKPIDEDEFMKKILFWIGEKNYGC